MNALTMAGLVAFALGVLVLLSYLDRRGVAAELAAVRQDVHATRRALARANLVAAAGHAEGDATAALTTVGALVDDVAVDDLDTGDRYAPLMRRGAPICMAVRDGYLCVRPHLEGRHVATAKGVVVRVWTDQADAVTETLAVGR